MEREGATHTDRSSSIDTILPRPSRSGLSFSKASTRAWNSANAASSVKRFSDSTLRTSQCRCNSGDSVGTRCSRASTLASVKCITSLVLSRPRVAMWSPYVCSGTALMCPPFLPVAPLQILRASRMATRTDSSLWSRCFATLHPVMPEPMMTTSTSSGSGVVSNCVGGDCQYACVGALMGRPGS